MNPPMNEGRIPQVLDVPSEVWRKKPPHLYPGPRGERFAWKSPAYCVMPGNVKSTSRKSRSNKRLHPAATGCFI